MMEPLAVFTSTTAVETPFASRYLGELCSHFASKLPVDCLAPGAGRIGLLSGEVALKADDQRLTIRLRSSDPAELGTAQRVLGRHLDRVARTERLDYRWVIEM